MPNARRDEMRSGDRQPTTGNLEQQARAEGLQYGLPGPLRAADGPPGNTSPSKEIQRLLQAPRAGVTGPSGSTGPSLQAARPATVLRLQRMIGNRNVQRMMASSPVQRGALEAGSPGGLSSDPTPEAIRQAAGAGLSTPSSPMPFMDQIQKSFGRHDVSSIKAHTGPGASSSAGAMNARAYASGDHVVFGRTPDLFTAAHEAAHVIQQLSGVQLSGGVGREGDPFEQHADAVAARVVSGQSAEGLLDRHAGRSPRTGEVVQRLTEDPELKNETPDRYVVTLAVYRKSKDYLAFQKARYWLKQHNNLRPQGGIKGKFKAWDNEKIKRKAAKRVILDWPEDKRPLPRDMEKVIDQVVANQEGATGHTWVKFQTYVKGSLRSVDSFGFHPFGQLTSPYQDVRGSIAHPDTAYERGSSEEETEGDVLYMDSTVSKARFDRAYSRALAIKDSPPNYRTFGYNCTSFAREIVKEAGVAFPARGDIVPRLGNWMVTYNPNALFLQLEAMRRRRQGHIYEKALEHEALVKKVEDAEEAQANKAASGPNVQHNALLDDVLDNRMTDYPLVNPNLNDEQLLEEEQDVAQPNVQSRQASLSFSQQLDLGVSNNLLFDPKANDAGPSLQQHNRPSSQVTPRQPSLSFSQQLDLGVSDNLLFGPEKNDVKKPDNEKKQSTPSGNGHARDASLSFSAFLNAESNNQQAIFNHDDDDELDKEHSIPV